MAKFRAWWLVFGLCLAGCRIETYEGSGPTDVETCESAKPAAPSCNADADCKDGQKCTSGGMCVTPSAAGCQRDSDCASASYCDVELGHCVASVSCSAEIDCDASMNCDSTRSTCVPAVDPTCGEIEDEANCVARVDCSPLYAGTNCSCGPDCTCKGGEPGCVCESFEFFRCEPSTP